MLALLKSLNIPKKAVRTFLIIAAALVVVLMISNITLLITNVTSTNKANAEFEQRKAAISRIEKDERSDRELIVDDILSEDEPEDTGSIFIEVPGSSTIPAY